MSTLEFRVAIRDALAEELERDPAVVFFGEDIAAAGGVFKATPELSARFGPERVFDTPISELALAGAAYGAAVTGLRPVFEVMFGDFMGLAMDSLVNQAAKFWYLSNEQGTVPLVVRSAVGAGGRFGAIHSQTHATWFQGVPGLKIVFPSSPAEAKGLLKASIRDDNPVIFLEHKRLYSVKGPPPDEELIPLGRAGIARRGNDLTIASVGKGVPDALAAAETLSQDGISAEVVDLRTLRPLDLETVRRRRWPGPTACLPSKRDRGPVAGRPGWSARSPSRRCTTSTTRGSWPPPRLRSRTAQPWRTRSCQTPTTSSAASGRGRASARPADPGRRYGCGRGRGSRSR